MAKYVREKELLPVQENTITTNRVTIEDLEQYLETKIEDTNGLNRNDMIRNIATVAKNMSDNLKRPLTEDEISRLVNEMQLQNEVFHPMWDDLSKECCEDFFDSSKYVDKKDGVAPIVTFSKLANMRKLHSSILVPIANFYKEKYPYLREMCVLNVINGITSRNNGVYYASGTYATLHSFGMAVDFFITSLEIDEVFQDIKHGIIPLEYGVLFKSNGVHITLPFTRGKETFRKTVIEFDNGSIKSIEEMEQS